MKAAIKQVLDEHGLTQVALAARTGIAQPTLSQYFQGGDKRRVPDVGNARKLAAEFGMGLDALYDLLAAEDPAGLPEGAQLGPDSDAMDLERIGTEG